MLNKFLFRTEYLYVLSLLLTIVSIVTAGYDMVTGAGGLMPVSNATFIGALVLFIVGIILDRKR
jgi:ABC-type branched-subunit amino acid transport system permease subunit